MFLLAGSITLVENVGNLNEEDTILQVLFAENICFSVTFNTCALSC